MTCAAIIFYGDGYQLEEVNCSNNCGKMIQQQYISFMLRLRVHAIRLTASTTMIQENIRANTRRSFPSFPYPISTSVRSGVFFMQIWKHTGRSVLLR